MSNVNTVKSVKANVVLSDEQLRKQAVATAATVKGLDAKKREELADALYRKAKRAQYMVKRNAKPEVRAKRKEYNKKRWQADKALLALARAAK